MFTMYILRNGKENQYKIGITNNLNRRLKELQTGCPYELEVIKLWTHPQEQQIKKYERVLHRYYDKLGKRIRPNGEWFALSSAEVMFLCEPHGIAEQNHYIKFILEQM